MWGGTNIAFAAPEEIQVYADEFADKAKSVLICIRIMSPWYKIIQPIHPFVSCGSHQN